jgi:hypothetical protein
MAVQSLGNPFSNDESVFRFLMIGVLWLEINGFSAISDQRNRDGIIRKAGNACEHAGNSRVSWPMIA